MRKRTADTTVKDADPAEGSRDSVNVPIDTDEAAEANEQIARSSTREAVDTTPEERDRDSAAPDADRRGHPRTTL